MQQTAQCKTKKALVRCFVGHLRVLKIYNHCFSATSLVSNHFSANGVAQHSVWNGWLLWNTCWYETIIYKIIFKLQAPGTNWDKNPRLNRKTFHDHYTFTIHWKINIIPFNDLYNNAKLSTFTSQWVCTLRSAWIHRDQHSLWVSGSNEPQNLEPDLLLNYSSSMSV